MPSVKGLTAWCRRPVPTFAAILFTALIASACQPRALEKLGASSASSKDTSRISIGTRSGSGVSSAAISATFPSGYTVPFSITQFDCFAIVVSASDIGTAPACGGQSQMGLVSGFVQRGGKLEIDVPMGARRIFQVWGFANSGSCPNAASLLFTPRGGLPPGVSSSGFLLGQRAVDVVEKKMSLDITVQFTLGVSAVVCGPEVGKPVTTILSARHDPSNTAVANQGKTNVNEDVCINIGSTATTPSYRCIQDSVEVPCNAGACPVVAGATTHRIPTSAGTHTFKVITTDTTTGLTEETPPVFTYTQDFVAPTLALTSIVPGGFDGVNTFYTASTTPTMRLTLDESGTVTRNVDAAGAVSCATFSAAGSSTCSLGTLALGVHAVSFIGTDTAGNAAAAINRNVVVDQTAPTITTNPVASSSSIWVMGGDLSNPGGPPNSVAVTTADPGGAVNPATFLCSLDSAATAACASPLAFTGSGGKHTATVSIRDYAGNLTVSSFNTFIDTLTGRVVLGRLNSYLGSLADESSAAALITTIPGDGGLSAPGQVAIDTSSNYVYVADTSNNRVLAFLWDPVSRTTIGHRAVGVLGQPNFILVSAGTTNTATYTPMSSPTGVALGTPSGGTKKLFVADTGNNRVLRFDISTGQGNRLAEVFFGQANSTTSGINFNSGTTSAVGGAIMQQGVNTPKGLYYHVDDNELYVADQENCRVAVWSAAGTTATSGDNLSRHLGTGNQALNGSWPCPPAAADARTLNRPQGLTYDLDQDKLYVADTSHNRILYWDSGSAATQATNASGVFGQTNFVLSAAGTTIAPPSLTAPAGVAIIVDGSNNRRVAASSFSAGTIGKTRFFDSALATTSVVTDWGSGLPGTTIATFTQPTQLLADGVSGTLFVSDTGNNRIMSFNTTGAPLPSDPSANDAIGHVKYSDGSISFRASAARNISDSTLNSPSGVAVDTSRGRLFVADTSNHRILVYLLNALTLKISSPLAFKAIGVPVLGFGNPLLDSTGVVFTLGADTLSSPSSLAYDSTGEDLYVTDTGNNRVLRFNVGTATIADGLTADIVLGQTLFTTNAAGAGAAALDGPTGIAFDVAGNVLYVSDTNNNRIQVWQNARTQSSGAAATNTIGALGTTAATLSAPRGLDVSATMAGGVLKGLWVADTGNHRVNYFDISAGAAPAAASACFGHHGASIAAGCALGGANDGGAIGANGAYALNGPQAVHANATEQRLYVSDSSNNRILAYDLTVAANQPASGAVFSAGHTGYHAIGASSLTVVGLGNASAVGIPAGIKTPRGIISLVPSSGAHQLYIVDPGYHRVGNYEVP